MVRVDQRLFLVDVHGRHARSTRAQSGHERARLDEARAGWIFVRSRMRTSTSVSRSRSASRSTSRAWSFQTVTSNGASLAKHGRARRLSK